MKYQCRIQVGEVSLSLSRTHTHTQANTYQWKPNLITIHKTRTQSERSADNASVASASTPRIFIESPWAHQKKDWTTIERRRHWQTSKQTLTHVHSHTDKHSFTHSLTHSGNRIEFSHLNRNIVWIRFECLLCHHLWLSHSLSPFLSRTRIRTLYLSLYIIYVYGIWALAYSRHIVALAHFDAWLGWRTLWSSWLLSWPKFLWHSTRNCAWLQIF